MRSLNVYDEGAVYVMELTTDHISLGEHIVPLTVRRDARAKRVSIRLSSSKNGVILTLPKRCAIATGMRFLYSKTEWLLGHLEQPVTTSFDYDTTLPVLGMPCTLRHKSGRGTTRYLPDNNVSEIHIYGAKQFFVRRTRDGLKKLLLQHCQKHAKIYAAMLEKKVSAIVIRDLNSRWGSCNESGKLTFNWRLIFAPLPVLEYIIAHEVAHLAEMNHSKRFWVIVERFCPDHEEIRNWLKLHGHTLYRYG